MRYTTAEQFMIIYIVGIFMVGAAFIIKERRCILESIKDFLNIRPKKKKVK